MTRLDEINERISKTIIYRNEEDLFAQYSELKATAYWLICRVERLERVLKHISNYPLENPHTLAARALTEEMK